MAICDDSAESHIRRLVYSEKVAFAPEGKDQLNSHTKQRTRADADSSVGPRIKGVDLRTVQELMGHKTIAMTVRYAHLAPSHQGEASERLASPRAVIAVQTATKTATSDFQVISERRREGAQAN